MAMIQTQGKPWPSPQETMEREWPFTASPRCLDFCAQATISQKIETTPKGYDVNDLLSEAEADPQRYPHLTAICQQFY